MRVWMGFTENWQMAKILTDNWHLPYPPHPDPLLYVDTENE